jgi:predicted lipid-binding transport protein (Tim44 family)
MANKTRARGWAAKPEVFTVLASRIPVDLVLFGMIAVFLILRLRSILGRRQGFEGVPETPPLRRAGGAPTIEGRAEPVPANARPLPDPASPAGQALAAMQKIDRHFTPAAFLTGAENAFRLIVTAFAAGDRDKLRPLLAPDVFGAFDAAITAREAEHHVQKTEIKSVLEATIDHAALAGNVATIAVRFVSQQISVTLGPDNAVIAGADALMEITDLWTFDRDLRGSSQVWRLSAAHSA